MKVIVGTIWIESGNKVVHSDDEDGDNEEEDEDNDDKG